MAWGRRRRATDSELRCTGEDEDEDEVEEEEDEEEEDEDEDEEEDEDEDEEEDEDDVGCSRKRKRTVSDVEVVARRQQAKKASAAALIHAVEDDEDDDEDEDDDDDDDEYRSVIAAAGEGGAPACFATSGTVDGALPGLSIAGVGPVALPVNADGVAKIVAVAARSPFGRREQTVLDEKVRRSWQIEPAAVTLSNPAFGEKVVAAARAAAAELGVDATRVRAELYKLLLYDTGAFFLPHRDTEKAPGMFATLVVVLPSVYTGGELVVEHGASRQIFDIGQHVGASYTSVFVAFFADCLHEVRPVTSGARIALVYNMYVGHAGAGTKERVPGVGC